MKHVAYILLCAPLLLTACHTHSEADDELNHHHNHSQAAPAADIEKNAEDGEKAVGDEIVLAPEMAERFGVVTDTVQPAPMATTLRATGTVLDAPGGAAVVSAPATGMVRFAAGVAPGARMCAGGLVATIDSRGVAGGDTNAAAKAALDAAQRELARLEPLHAERLVTDDVYNAARAAYESARAAYSSRADGGRAISPIAGTITSVDVAQGQYVEAGAPIATVSAAERLVLRVDVAERMRSRLAAVDGVNVRVPGSEQVVALKGRRVASGPAVSASMPGYVPVYFEFDNDGTIAPGSVVDAWLTAAGSGAPVISVPRTAIAEQQGSYFVYVRLDEDCYRKLPVRLGASDGVRVVITSGLQGGENVVTGGVTAVRLAETSGAIPEGHSHNH